MLPLEFDYLVDIIKTIPSISNKQAQKIAKYLIDQNIENLKKNSALIFDYLKKIKKCVLCSYYTNDKLCNICLSLDRDKKLLIIENVDQIFQYEKWKIYYGKYYLFPQLFNEKLVQKKITFDWSPFFDYLKEFEEIIIGISPNQQGILTINYLLEEINKNIPHIKVSQLAIGIPFGVSIDYIDQLTMSYAIKNRKDIK